MTDAATAVTPRDFTFVLPDEWFRIRLDKPSRDDDVDALVDLMTGQRPDRDSLGPALRELVHDACDAVGDLYATEVYLSLSKAAGFPIACSLVVSVVPPQRSRASGAEVVAGFLGAQRDATERGRVEIVAGPAGRVRRRVTAEMDGSHRYPTEVVQYLVVVPGSTGFVMLSFSTPLVGVAEPMCALFDAVAESFRWVW